MTNLNFIRDYTSSWDYISESNINYLLDESTFKGYIGPRQCGKTYLLYQDLICNAVHEPGDYLVISSSVYTSRTIQIYINNCLENFMLQSRVVYANAACSTYRIPNGSEITFISGHDIINRLRGKKYKCVYIDEPQFVSNLIGIIDFLSPTVLLRRGCISVFGTIDEELEDRLIEKNFNFTYNANR